MGLLVYSFLFFLLAWVNICRKETIVLALLAIFLWCNKEYYINTDNELYYVRSFLAFASANILLYFKTKIGMYQAGMQLLILIAYLCLAYDVINNKHILIYNNYEAVIYGLVAFQFIGFFPNIRDRLYDIFTNINFNKKYYYQGQKT